MAKKEVQEIENEISSKIKEFEYSKKELLSSLKYSNRKDVLKVILKEEKMYTFKEVDELLNKFMKGSVK